MGSWNGKSEWEVGMRSWNGKLEWEIGLATEILIQSKQIFNYNNTRENWMDWWLFFGWARTYTIRCIVHATLSDSLSRMSDRFWLFPFFNSCAMYKTLWIPRPERQLNQLGSAPMKTIKEYSNFNVTPSIIPFLWFPRFHYFVSLAYHLSMRGFCGYYYYCAFLLFSIFQSLLYVASCLLEHATTGNNNSRLTFRFNTSFF